MMLEADIVNCYESALDFHKAGKLQEARSLYSEILRIHPQHHDSLLMTGQSFYQEGKFSQALDYLDHARQLKPLAISFALLHAKTLMKVGRNKEASLRFDELLAQQDDHTGLLFHSARNDKQLGFAKRAIEKYQRLLQLEPTHLQALNNLGNVYQAEGLLDEALACYEQLIAVDEESSMAYCNKAALLFKLYRLDEARELLKKALAIDPGNAAAFYHLGMIAGMEGSSSQALNLIQEAIKRDPENVKFLSTYAYYVFIEGDFEGAEKQLKRLISSQTINDAPYLKLSRIYQAAGRNEEAIMVLRTLLEKNPTSIAGYYELGVLLDLVQAFDEAETCLLKVWDHPTYALRTTMTLQMLYSKTGRLSKYDELLERTSHLLKQYASGIDVEEELPIYNLAYYPLDLDLAYRTRQKFGAHLTNRMKPLRTQVSFSYRHSSKIRIGYLSPYFKMHPSAQLIVDVLRLHDRTDFEIIAYGLNREEDEVTASIRSYVDQYVDLSDVRPKEAAHRINQDGISILVSLAGFNFEMKNEIPALRPAPIQVVGMDYHESMQVDFYDYVLKDEVVLTPETRSFYNESIAYLPCSHFFRSQIISSGNQINRSDYGLPEKAFVFGCLNHPRKWNPSILKTWFRILNEVPQAVLWLYDGGKELVRKNIHAFAGDNHIEKDRIVFCGHENARDHYQRMELIDLFLDTPFYNGHTTCLEALWMSVPVLTIQGETVSARMATSYLTDLKLDELICANHEEYVDRATNYATDSELYFKLADKMRKARATGNLFDVDGFVRKLEAAYSKMWSDHINELAPQDFKITA